MNTSVFKHRSILNMKPKRFIFGADCKDVTVSVAKIACYQMLLFNEHYIRIIFVPFQNFSSLDVNSSKKNYRIAEQ